MTRLEWDTRESRVLFQQDVSHLSVQEQIELLQDNLKLMWGLDGVTRYMRALSGGPYWPYGGIAPGGDEWGEVAS